MSHFGRKVVCSISRNLDGPSRSQRDTVRRHTSSQLFCKMTNDSASVNKPKMQYRFVLCAASLRVNPSCLISTSCVLAVPINSPSLGAIAALYALILNDHVLHRSLPSCSPEYTFVSVKSFVSTRLNPACTSVCAVAIRCAFNSCATAFSCAACNATSSLNCWISSAGTLTCWRHTRNKTLSILRIEIRQRGKDEETSMTQWTQWVDRQAARGAQS